ncbi:MAG: hypothetical protein N2689_09845 [Verrucomicrobiae bacterium]|nr:hypothetical protein [Verrucomicrobiae bacterium]
MDLLLIGDSSALMGVDTPLLGKLISSRVESLATIGMFSPVGYARMLGLYLDRGRKPRTLLFLLHPGVLNYQLEWAEVESYGIDDQRAKQPEQPLWKAARDKLLHEIAYRVIAYPLRGAYGRFYGSASRFQAWLLDHQGSAVDPALPTDLEARPLTDEAEKLRLVKFSPLMKEKLASLADIVDRVSPSNTFVGLTPIANRLRDPLVERAVTENLRTLANCLHLPADHALPLPMSVPDGMCVGWHLTEQGRDFYTRKLAEILRDILPAKASL